MHHAIGVTEGQTLNYGWKERTHLQREGGLGVRCTDYTFFLGWFDVNKSGDFASKVTGDLDKLQVSTVSYKIIAV